MRIPRTHEDVRDHLNVSDTPYRCYSTVDQKDDTGLWLVLVRWAEVRTFDQMSLVGR